MDLEHGERLPNELALLEAMYPDQVNWDCNSRELKYTAADRSFQLRLPDGYLLDQLPEVLQATVRREDARERLRDHIGSCNPGEELLDSIIFSFTELSDSCTSSGEVNAGSGDLDPNNLRKATVIVWLHHLLNTNKRKLALSPASPEVSGVTKPGYPGVLIYSGLADAVNEHVNTLKQQNWQAFQIRFESEERWTFSHGPGVREVEAMKDVVAEVGLERKDAFMEAMRMR